MDNLNFGQAVESIKKGKKAQRAGWSGYVFLVVGEALTQKAAEHYGNIEGGDILPVADVIYAKTKDNILTPVTFSQADILAEDWAIID